MSYHPDDLAKYLSLILIDIIKNNPNYLIEEYKKYNWESEKTIENINTYFSAHLDRLVCNPEKIQYDLILNTSLSLFRKFLVPFKLSDKNIIALLLKNKLGEYVTDKSETLEFSILLVDIENISLDIIAEDLIKKVSNYPLRHHLAFGNWKKLGKKDEELHARGYELFHVPSGKNNADNRMTNMGSFICLNYPNIKEIFVCSSDHDFDILCDFLSKKEITVYRVFHKVNNLCIKNTTTEKIISYPIISNNKILNLQTLVKELKIIVYKSMTTKSEHQQWIKLTQVATLFHQKFKLNLNHAVDHHFPGKTAKFIFGEYKSDFVVHDPPDSQDVFITLFNVEKENIPRTSESNKESLEKMLIAILKEETNNDKNKKVEVGHIALKFLQKYKIPITKALKNAKLSGKYKTFLESIPKLDLINEGSRSFIRLR